MSYVPGVARVYSFCAEGANAVEGTTGILPRENVEIPRLWNAISCILGCDFTKFRRL
jgi:hypothetical protein